VKKPLATNDAKGQSRAAVGAAAGRHFPKRLRTGILAFLLSPTLARSACSVGKPEILLRQMADEVERKPFLQGRLDD